MQNLIVTLATQTKILSVKWEVLRHPPYSPDISPSDYYLFLSLSIFCHKRVNLKKKVKTGVDLFFLSKKSDFFLV